MSRVQLKSSLTDDHARLIARAIAEGKPPPFNAHLDEYCESSPHEIFAAFTGAARHMPPAGSDEALALGYLFVLQRLLEHLRYQTDRGYADAAKLIADFQAGVVAQIKAGQVNQNMLAFVGGALHQSKIPASPEFSAASATHSVDQYESQPVPDDACAALLGVLETCGGDPFMAVGALLEASHAIPAAARGTLASGLALAGIPGGPAVAVLFLLDPSSAVRRAVAGALEQIAASLTPMEVRRLITIRNWRPENERAEVDAIIRKARAAGIDCAQWDPGSSIEGIVATAIDGAATQGFLLVSPAGRKKRLSSLLTKVGIADAWSGEPESRRRIETSLADAGMGTPVLVVSRTYLDRMVAHHLVLSSERGEAPPFGLLQVAETIGGADWQPARITFSEALAELIDQVPKAMCRPAAVSSILQKSHELADLEAIAESWFEDDPEVAQLVQHACGDNYAKLATYLLQSIIPRRRDRWIEIILRTALWMREAPAEADLCWRELAIVGKALADGRDMNEIGLMREIALRTIAVLTSL